MHALNHKFRLTVLVIALSVNGASVLAQDETPPPASDESDASLAPPGQEVEVNEDNYRQFMELQDDLRQRQVLPEESFQSRSGDQKLDKLPLGKHLDRPVHNIATVLRIADVNYRRWHIVRSSAGRSSP